MRPKKSQLLIELLIIGHDSATLAATSTVIDTTDTTCFIAMYDSATGSLASKTGPLLCNATTGALYPEVDGQFLGDGILRWYLMLAPSTTTNPSILFADGVEPTTPAE